MSIIPQLSNSFTRWSLTSSSQHVPHLLLVISALPLLCITLPLFFHQFSWLELESLSPPLRLCIVHNSTLIVPRSSPRNYSSGAQMFPTFCPLPHVSLFISAALSVTTHSTRLLSTATNTGLSHQEMAALKTAFRIIPLSFSSSLVLCPRSARQSHAAFNVSPIQLSLAGPRSHQQ